MNTTLEIRLLGILLDHDIAADIASAITNGSEFTDPDCGTIFDQLVSLRARGVRIDADTLALRFRQLSLPIPDAIPDPVTWTRNDHAATAGDLAATIHIDHVRRTGLAALAWATPALNDRTTDPLTTLTALRRDVDTVIDSNTHDDGDGVMTLGEALASDATYDWLIPGLLERQDRLVITGSEGSGKTMLIRQIAISAAAGLHPLDHTQAEPRRVLVIDAENTYRQWKRTSQVVAAQIAQMGRRDPRPHLHLTCRGRIDITNPVDEAHIHRLIDQYKPDILAIGPLYKLVPHAITNDDHAAPVITALDALRDRGLTLLIEAHAGHATNLQGDRDMRPRGSSALLGWPEFGFGIRPVAEDPDMSAVVRWRGDRDQRAWPKHIRRGGLLPWTVADVDAYR